MRHKHELMMTSFLWVSWSRDQAQLGDLNHEVCNCISGGKLKFLNAAKIYKYI